MSLPAAHVRFVGMLSADGAEAVARGCIAGLERVYGDVKGWDVCVQPPLASWPCGGYAVRVQARLADGGMISIRSQGGELLATVRDAFEGLEELLQQDGERPDRTHGWLPTLAGDARPATA